MTASARAAPPTVLHRPSGLALARERYRAKDAALKPAIQTLRADAEEALRAEACTIVHKPQHPPSGDPHDYMSMGPYWWPDPASEDGLPYIRRDGQANPEWEQFDRPKLNGMTDSVEALALGSYFLGDPDHGRRAAELLRAFFLDERTRMNPNLRFAQAIPGQSEGRGIGIIETSVLAKQLVDAMLLLHHTGALDEAELDALRAWFDDYLTWLLHSEHGAAEREEPNNHGTAFDVQLAVFARFVHRDDLAREVLTGVLEKRIATQIEPDGRQPYELKRTKSMHYTAANLALLFDLAELAEGFDPDLWRYETSDGRGIRKALDWLVPFWTGEASWTHQQILPFPFERAYALLRRAAWAYDGPEYERAIDRLALEPRSPDAPPPASGSETCDATCIPRNHPPATPPGRGRSPRSRDPHEHDHRRPPEARTDP